MHILKDTFHKLQFFSVQQIIQQISMYTMNKKKKKEKSFSVCLLCLYHRVLIYTVKIKTSMKNNIKFVYLIDHLIVQDYLMFVMDFLHLILLNQFVEEVLVQLL